MDGRLMVCLYLNIVFVSLLRPPTRDENEIKKKERKELKKTWGFLTEFDSTLYLTLVETT
jgi:hypothetical protein